MQQKKAKEKKDYIKLLPIGLILLLVPVIVYMKTVNLDTVVATYWKGSTIDIDFFSYYKMVWFIALTCLATLFFIFYITTKKIKLTFSKIFIPLATYIGFVFLSSCFSEFHTQAFFGFPDRYEGFFTILCYILICFLCSIMINSYFDIKFLLTFLAVSVLVVSVIGVTQFFGFDFLQSSIGKSLMLPNDNQNMAKSLTFNFPEKYIYSTLYNPNYVGGFFAMILPICLVLFVSVKSNKYKILYGIFCVLSFVNLLGSKSNTGYISALIAGIIMLVYFRKVLRRNIIPLICIFICFMVATAVMNYTSGGIFLKGVGMTSSLINNDDKSLIPVLQKVSQPSTSSYYCQKTGTELNNVSADLKGTNGNFETLNLQTVSKSEDTRSNTSFKTLALNSEQNDTSTGDLEDIALQNSANASLITNVKIDKNKLFLFVSDTDALVIEYDSQSTELNFSDNNNKSMDLITDTVDDKYIINFKDIRFNKFNIFVKSSLLSVEAPNTKFNLAITKDGIKFLTPSGQLTDIVHAESFGFEGKELWGSSRGYIWSRSIPLLKDTVLFGHGPDTFSIFFPQNDYMGKSRAFNNMYTVVDKPHNMYLQMAINTGVLSLIAFLVFIGWYCISALKLYFKGLYNEYYAPGIACLVAVISYLVSSLANDSTISVSPVFWILLGIGIACNRLYSKEVLTKSNTKQNVNTRT